MGTDSKVKHISERKLLKKHKWEENA